MCHMNEFSNWLLKEIKEAGLSYSEISRRGGPSHARISQVISSAKPGLDFCIGIAHVLNIPRKRVFRKAGFLPSRPHVIGEQKEELDDYYEALSQADRGRLVAIAKTLHEQQTKYNADE